MPIKSFQGARVTPKRSLAKNLVVKDIMTKNLITFTSDQTIHEVMKSFIKFKVSGGPVVDKYGNKEAGFDLRSDGIALGN